MISSTLGLLAIMAFVFTVGVRTGIRFHTVSQAQDRHIAETLALIDADRLWLCSNCGDISDRG